MPRGRTFGTFQYRTPEALEERIEAFYAYCEEHDKPMTVTRLAAFLDLTRAAVWNYSNRDEFAPIIARAKAMIEADMEERLQSGKGSAAGVIFSFKNNFGWKDQTEIKQDLNVTTHESALGELENALAAGITSAQDTSGQSDGLREDMPVH